MHILLIEDSHTDVLLAREALKDILEGPYRLSVANDGQEALDFLFKKGAFAHEQTPDIVLLDLHIPRVSGLEVLETIKNDIRTRIIPVAVFSTSDAQADVHEAYFRHANCYLTKPMDFNEFVLSLQCLFHFWFKVAAPGKVRLRP